MKRVLFVHYGFETGGICSSLMGFLHCLSQQKDIAIYLMVLNGGNADTVDLPTEVVLIETPRIIKTINSSLNKIKENRNIFDVLIYAISRILQMTIGKVLTASFFSYMCKLPDKYDVAISFANDIYKENKCIMCGCNQFVSYGVKADRKIGWIHANANQIGYTHRSIIKTYNRFDAIVNCNSACKSIFDKIAPEYSNKSTYVHNVISIERITKLANQQNPYEENSFHIVTVSRIENATKRLDRIPRIAHLLKKEGLVFEWHIVGNGPDYSELDKQIHELQVGDCVFLHGEKSNPYPYIYHADVYVLTSDYEAMPMVVLEAEALHVPVISTDYPAASEMIPPHCGIICKKNETLIAEAISCLKSSRKQYTNVNVSLDGQDQLTRLLNIS